MCIHFYLRYFLEKLLSQVLFIFAELFTLKKNIFSEEIDKLRDILTPDYSDLKMRDPRGRNRSWQTDCSLMFIYILRLIHGQSTRERRKHMMTGVVFGDVGSSVRLGRKGCVYGGGRAKRERVSVWKRGISAEGCSCLHFTFPPHPSRCLGVGVFRGLQNGCHPHQISEFGGGHSVLEFSLSYSLYTPFVRCTIRVLPPLSPNTPCLPFQ